MNQEVIKGIITDFQKRPLPRLTNRDVRLEFVENMVLSIVGCRRSGKTYRTFQFVKQCLEEGVSVENICRVQFNDHRLSRLKSEDLSCINEAYYALFPGKRGSEKVYFIFDEIHRIEGWEDYVLHLLEEPTHQVLITGSTSRLQKGEISTALRGKNLSVVLYPFSFREFLKHYDIPPDVTSSAGRAHLRNMLGRYLSQGAFPGLLEVSEQMHLEILQSYWDTMIFRDIIEAHADEGINVPVFTYFAQSLISRMACPMTVRKISQDMHEAGLSFTAGSLYQYLRFLDEAYMVFTVPIYSTSEKVKKRNYQKIYAIDWALAEAIAPAGEVDITRKFENMIYLELRRRKNAVYYYKTRKGFEVDFIALARKGRKKPKNLYQVCYQFDDKEVRQRECRGIPETIKFLGIDQAYIITANEEDLLKIDGVEVKVVPAWKWLLET